MLEIKKKYNDWLNKDKKIISNEKKINELIDTFLSKFAKEKIANLSIDQYVIGKGSKDTFCYWVEHKLKDAGSIRGNHPSSYGVYYNKDSRNYKVTKKNGGDDYKKAFEQIKKLIIDVIEASKKHDLNKIAQSKLANMFKNKIAYLYNRNYYLPIYNKDHINILLNKFKQEKTKNETIEDKKQTLFNFYKSLNLKDCSPWRFMQFLYNKNGYRDDLIAQKKNHIEDYEIDEQLLNEGKEVTKKCKYRDRDWRIRDVYLKKNGYVCKLCNKSYLKGNNNKNDWIIDVHHLKPIKDGQRYTNICKDLKGLCPNCHRFVHSINDYENKSWEQIKKIYNNIYKNNN